VAEALAWPTRGPRWVCDRVAQTGLVVAPVTVWRVLRRVGLHRRLARLAVLSTGTQFSPVIGSENSPPLVDDDVIGIEKSPPYAGTSAGLTRPALSLSFNR